MNRILGIILAAVWLVCMTALVQRDVLPFWTAQEPPDQGIPNGRYQCRIETNTGKRIGTAWVACTAGPQLTTVDSLTLLDVGRITGLFKGMGRLTVQTDLSYEKNGTLSMFKFNLQGAGMPIDVVGERYVHDFSCVARIGESRTSILLDGRMYERLTESLRPFVHLSGLHIGQSWRIRLLDPLAMLKGESFPFSEQLVRVTKRERIRHRGDDVDCFRVESPGTVAWADDEGKVLRQELSVPLLGKIVLTDEPYDRKSHHTATVSAGRGSIQEESTGAALWELSREP